MTKTWQGGGDDDWTNGGDWSPVGVPGSTDDVVVDTGQPQITTNVGTINSLKIGTTAVSSVNLTASTTTPVTTGELTVSGMTDVDDFGSVDLSSGGTLITGGMTNDGLVSLDGGVFSGTGGSSLTVEGLLDNAGTISRGSTFDERGEGDTVTTDELDNTGTISLGGSTNELNLINVTGQNAGFGTQGVLSGIVTLANNSIIQFAGGGIDKLDGDLTLDGTLASIQDANGAVNSALSGVSEIDDNSALSLGDAASLTLDGDLENNGAIGLDTFSTSVGGASLTVDGVLTNSASGDITIDAKNGPDTISVEGLSNPEQGANGGDILLNGSGADLAELDVTEQSAGFGTTGVLTGIVELLDDALLQFNGGEIATIGGGTFDTRAQLLLDGDQASLGNGGGQDSGLAIANIETSSSLELLDGASVTTGNLDDAGTIGLDTDYNTESGSRLTVDGTLDDTGSIGIDAPHAGDTLTSEYLVSTGDISLVGGTTTLAELDVTNQAAGFGTEGVLTGDVSLFGDSLLQFAGGEITEIAAKSELTLDGGIESLSNGDGQNSAVTGLDENDGTFNLQDGASLDLTGGLTNDDTISLNNFHESTADTLEVAGTLTNNGSISLNPDQAATTIDTDYLTNNGTIDLQGSSDGGDIEALLDVTDQAAGFGTVGVLTGDVDLNGESGQAVIQFDGGDIATIAAKADLTINGAQASLSNGGGLNSALTSLDDDYGTFSLQDDASLSLTGGLDVEGNLYINNFHASGADTLDVGGTLTNSGVISLSPDQAATTIDAKGLLNAGTIELQGSSDGGDIEALLDVANQAGFGTVDDLTGHVNLDGDNGQAVIEFASGGITTIATGGELTLQGALASVQDAGGAQNGALTGLSSIVGALTLENGATLSTGGAAAGSADELVVGDAMTVSGQINATTIDITSVGSIMLSSGFANAAVTVESGGVFAGTGSAGAVTVASGGTFDPGADPGTLNTGSLALSSGSNFGIEIGGTASGEYDQDNVAGTVSLGGAALDLTLVGGFTPVVGDDFTIIRNDGTDAVSGAFAGLAQGATFDADGYEFMINYSGGDGNDVVLTAEGVACYCRGVRIDTDRGEIAVERLQIGDLVVTASGALRPIQWIGRRRLNASRHPDPAAVWPICIRAGAFGDNLPRRDLLVSPGHNIAWEGALTPADALMNGHSVVQIEQDQVEYWHVELDEHDVILAEGLPAESYLDTGNRCAFENGDAFIEAHPDFKSKHWAETCLPIVADGPQVTNTRRLLLDRLQAQGREVSEEADAHLMADGVRIEPLRLSATRMAFVLPEGRRSLTLMSRTFVPAHTFAESRDMRRLGLCVQRLQVDGEALAFGQARAGWHASESFEGQFAHCWTNGAAQLPQGARMVIIELAGRGYYGEDRGGEAASQAA